MTITINTLPNLMNHGFRIGTDIEQFERDIWGIKSQSYGQIAVRVEAFLAQYGNVEIPVVTDAQDFLEAKRTNGDLDKAAAKLYKSASDFAAIIEPNGMVEDLVQTTGWSVDLAVLWNQAAYGLRNRGARFARITPTRCPPRRIVMATAPSPINWPRTGTIFDKCPFCSPYQIL